MLDNQQSLSQIHSHFREGIQALGKSCASSTGVSDRRGVGVSGIESRGPDWGVAGGNNLLELEF